MARLWILALVAASGLAVVRAPVSQAAPRPQAASILLTAQAGFDGYYRDGQWLPVRVTVENNGPDVAGQLQIVNPSSNSTAEVVYTRDLQLSTQSRREFFMYLAPEGYASSLDIRVKSGSQTLAAKSLRLTQIATTDLLLGVLASSPSAFSFLNNLAPIGGQASVAQLAAADLPPLAQGWQTLDALVISDSDTGALSPEQRAAMRDWVSGGGRLLVMGGPNWQKTAAGLSDLLPLAPNGAQPAPGLEALVAYATAATSPEGSAVAATGPLAGDAEVLVQAGSLPLIAARPLGYGQVIFFALDPALVPLRGWDGSPELFRRVLGTPLERPGWAAGLVNWSSAQSAVDALPSLQLPNPFLICGFLGLYLVIVGPLNYVVLRRVKRRELAWLTIPVIVIGFSLVAYFVGYGLAGTEPTLHQLAFVQAAPGAAQARVDQVVGLFSPRRTTYDIDFAAGWLVRPSPDTSMPGLNSLRVEQTERTRLLGVRTEIAAVQTFIAQGAIPTPRFESTLRLEAVNGTARLVGALTNHSALTLTDAVLLAPGGTLQLGSFAPGETRNIALVLMPGRAASPSGGVVVPGKGATIPAVPPPNNSSAAPDTTLDDILYTSHGNYYADREQFRRYSLLTAAASYGNYGLVRGSGVYLVGWTTSAPAPASLVNGEFKTMAETVYLLGLPAKLEVGQSPLTLPPGLMRWTLITSTKTGNAVAPYDATLNAGEQYAVLYTPIRPLAYRQVQALTLNLDGSSSTATVNAPMTVPVVELWDFAGNAWTAVPAVVYGRQTISEPARFVGPGGEIRTRLTNPGTETISLTAVEFSLTVAP